MNLPSLPELSRAEYDILRVIWKDGKQTVREVHDKLQQTNGWAYTTTKTMMDRMVQKELLDRSEFHGIFLYTALISRPAGLAKLVQFFAERVLETDAAQVVSMFASSQTLSPQELVELEDLLKDNNEDK
ncbi:MAG TPA: BlaI/MecI/CopY family transcriptional regulator [bacterium]|nr:BlaI/MecI/CopY family transcriptional regulator [bacterium]HPN44664.1 BlaI/MecI/CopY family transcriptional regulator [bacterium]